MTIYPEQNNQNHTDWHKAVSLDVLKRQQQMKVRVNGKQIALFHSPRGVLACDNSCPHEGFPLSEGSLSDNCKLTCNWHNWKFDLRTGENLYGGDRLTVYPVEVHNDQIWVDMTEPPFEQQYQRVVDSLREAFDDHSYGRIAREIARLASIGGDPLDALRLAIAWSWQRLEFGWTHAYAGMADWLGLYEKVESDEEARLLCLVESVGHVADDVLRQEDYPFVEGESPYDQHRFLDAIEREDEASAIAILRGALAAGYGFADLEYAFTRAALAHYNDFGHSLIYVTKAGQLIDSLGSGVAKPLLLSLVRSLIFARREDRIPEFRDYQNALENWGGGHNKLPDSPRWQKQGIRPSLDYVIQHSESDKPELFRHLLYRNAMNFLRFDSGQTEKTHVSVSGNVGWLDFTHGITFSNAVRKQCEKFPDLWPAGLLQMACFSGRNASYTDEDASMEEWYPADSRVALDGMLERVINHGAGEYIVSVHLLKTYLAVREEAAMADRHVANTLVAGLNRFLHSPLRRRQPRRTAYQSLQFIAKSR